MKRIFRGYIVRQDVLIFLGILFYLENFVGSTRELDEYSKLFFLKIEVSK